MAESRRILPAPRLRFPGRRFPHRAGAPGVRDGLAVPESGAERNRVVDFLGARGGRAESESANRYLPAAIADAAAAHFETAARESESAARNVEDCGESRIAADSNQDAAR